jgi:thiamine-monophosphate kinase
VEFDLIRRFVEGLRSPRDPRVRVATGDDCAVLDAGPLAISIDMVVEDVHFRRAWLGPEEIGYRAAAAALSDLAAMAAEPVGLVASLALPPSDAGDYAVAVMRGVREAAVAAGATLLGGDVVRSREGLVVDLCVFGHAPEPVRRSGGRPGDELWVTGLLGGAAAAVAAWESGRTPEEALRRAFARPPLRAREARWLADHADVRALIDLSDGLAGDAGHIAAASGVGAVLDGAAVPVDAAATAFAGSAEAARQLALGGGEDYELLVAGRGIGAVAEAFRSSFGTALTRVGELVDGGGVRLRGADGGTRPLDVGGFSHFGTEDG